MSRSLSAVAGAVGAGILGLVLVNHYDVTPKPTPLPAPAPLPAPLPGRGCPYACGIGCHRRYQHQEPAKDLVAPLFVAGAEPGQPVEGGLVSPDGAEEIQCPLPASEKKKNAAGVDGNGLCCFTSVEYAARWCNERPLFDFQAQMKRERGWGWPEKLDRMMKKYAPSVPYLQATTGDLGLLRAALASRRQVGVLYSGHDPHHKGTIAHMVTLEHLSDRWAAISDNEYPGDQQHVWMSPAEFTKRWKASGENWAVVLLHVGPPLPPRRS